MTKEGEIFKMPIPKLDGPVIVCKIDISKIDSSTRPIKPVKENKKRYDDLPISRDELDSGWGISFKMVKRNFKRQSSRRQ